MRFQISLEATTSRERTTDDEHDAEQIPTQTRMQDFGQRLQRQFDESQQMKRIPRNEQDEDRWRHAMPGRDPVTEERGPGM